MIGAGDGDHRVTVGIGSHSGALFVRRTPRGNEMNFVQVVTPLGGARYREMTDVDGIEGAPEKRDAPLARVSPGNAVRFRRRDAQRPSLRAAAGEAAEECGGAGDSLFCGSCKSVAWSALFSSGWEGAKRSSASAMPRTSCGMPSPEAEEMA